MAADGGDSCSISDEEEVSEDVSVAELCLKKVVKEILCLRQEQVEAEALLEAKKEEHKTKDLRQRREELEKNRVSRHAFYGADMPPKGRELARTVRKAELDMQEVLEKDAQITRMKKVLAELNGRHEKIRVSAQCSKKATEITQRALKMTEKPFKDGQELLIRLQSLLVTREQLQQRCAELQAEVDQQREELQDIQQQQRMFRIKKTTELSKLEAELDQAFCEARTWERKWNDIETTALKKTLEQHEMKMAVLCMYERIGGSVGEGGVALDDTLAQLEKMKIFILDHRDVVTQCENTFVVDEEKIRKILMQAKKTKQFRRQ